MIVRLTNFIDKHFTVVRWAIFAAVLTIVVISTVKNFNRPVKADVEAYLHAAEAVLKQENIYQTPSREMSAGGVYYLYLPLLAILFVPLTFLSWNAAAALWYLLNVFLTFWTVKMFYEAISGEKFFSLAPKQRWVIAFFPILLSLRFILYHLSYAQANILLVALIVCGLKLTAKKRDEAGGFLIGAATVIKTIAIPFLFWFVVRGSLRTLFGVAAGIFIGAILIPGLVFGFDKNWEYVSFWFNQIVLAEDLGTGKVPLPFNVSLQALLHRLFENRAAFNYQGSPVSFTIVALSAETIKILERLIQAAVLFFIAVYAFKYRKSTELVSKWGGAALTFAMIPLFAPTAQKHYFVMLLPAYLYVVYVWYFLQLKDFWFRAFVAASFVLATLTTDGIVGDTLDDFFTVSGFIAYGTIMLAFAVFRAASCLEKINVANPAVERT